MIYIFGTPYAPVSKIPSLKITRKRQFYTGTQAYEVGRSDAQAKNQFYRNIPPLLPWAPFKF